MRPADRRRPEGALLRRLTNLVREPARPAGCRQPRWTWFDRVIIRHLAWRQYGPEGRGPHLVWD